MSSHPTRSTLISATGIVAIILFGVAVLWFLIPDDTALVQKLVMDGNYQRSLAVFEKIPPSIRQKRPEYYAGLELRIRRNLLDPQNAAEVQQHLAKAAAAADQMNGADDVFQELLEALRLAPRSDTAFNRIQPVAGKLTQSQRSQIADVLVRKALAEGTPRAAAQIHHTLIPNPNIDQLQERVKLWRMAGEPKEAVYAVDDYLAFRKQNLQQVDEKISDLFVQVLRETGDNERALVVLQERLSTARRSEEAAPYLESLRQTALNAGRLDLIKDDFEAWLEKNADDRNALKLYGEILLASGDSERAAEIYGQLVQLEPANREFRVKYANALEWSDQPEIAWDYYLAEAKAGNQQALERLIELNPGLNRHEDLAEAYEAVPATYEDEKLLNQLAELRVYLGHYKEAADLYSRLRQMNPEKLDYLFQRGLLLEALLQTEEALACFSELLRINPQHAAAQEKVAMLLCYAKRFDEAVPYFRNIAETRKEAKAIERYQILVTGLGRMEEVAEALELKLKYDPARQPKDYIMLADVFKMLRQPDKELAAARLGLSAFPDDLSMQTYAVQLMMDRKQFAEARSLLARMHNLGTDRSLAEFYMDILSEAEDYSALERFIVDQLQPSLRQKLETRKLLAEAYQNQRKLEQARVIYREIYRMENSLTSAIQLAEISMELNDLDEAKRVLAPWQKVDDPELTPLLAQIALKDKRYQASEHLQKKVLLQNHGKGSDNWEVLGDIYAEQGKKESARAAWRQALKELEPPSAAPLAQKRQLTRENRIRLARE